MRIAVGFTLVMTISDSLRWEQRYLENNTQWDLGQPAPPFVSLLASAERPSPGKIAVLGCGRGHDALLFAQSGFEVIAFDFAPSAIATGQALKGAHGLSAQFLLRNIFELRQEFSGYFDYVLEHTCFCAIEPDQRQNYVRVVDSILKPGGEFLGLFWNHARSGGPPFGSPMDDIKTLFSPFFDTTNIKTVENSIASRVGEESLARFLHYGTRFLV